MNIKLLGKKLLNSDNMQFLIIIPAKGNSRRIPNKNMVLLNGKPLIYYTLAVCKKFRDQIDTLISTDSSKIHKYCGSQGFRYIHKRPKSLGTHKTTMAQVIINVVNWLKKKKLKANNLILLQPTSPLRTYNELKKAIRFYKKNNLNSLASISYLRTPADTCIKKTKNKWSYLTKKKEKDSQSHNYSKNFHNIDGSIYIVSLNFFKKNKTFVKENKTTLLQLNNEFSTEVDYERDLVIAKHFLKRR